MSIDLKKEIHFPLLTGIGLSAPMCVEEGSAGGLFPQLEQQKSLWLPVMDSLPARESPEETFRVGA
jgi:hypothetical protein